MSREDRLIEALEPLASEHGLDLVTVEVAGTRKRPILRVFLDTPAGGITLDELVDAQEWVDATIEEVDPFIESYDLEVSSPGIDRFAGEMTVIYLKPGAPRSKYTGISHGLDGDELVLEMEDGTMERIAFDRIKRAHIIGQIDFGGRNFDDEDAPLGQDN